MVGSDSIHVGSVPHPRAYGAFPRFLGRLRRQFDTISLEQTVQRMTDNPARRFNLTDRGRIAEGYFADEGLEVDMYTPSGKVKEVREDSPAAKAGIEPGDVITQLEGKDIRVKSIGPFAKLKSRIIIRLKPFNNRIRCEFP